MTKITEFGPKMGLRLDKSSISYKKVSRLLKSDFLICVLEYVTELEKYYANMANCCQLFVSPGTKFRSMIFAR